MFPERGKREEVKRREREESLAVSLCAAIP
jgi:hypothetical protein